MICHSKPILKALLSGCVLLLVGATSAGWLNFGGDPSRPWFIPQTIPEKPALLKTEVVAPSFSGLYLSPVVVGNTLFTFSIAGGVLTAYDLTALEIIWQKKFPDSKLANQKSFSSDGNNLLIPFGFTGKVVAISAQTGEINWAFNVGANEIPTGNVFYKGLFVFATDKGGVFALSPEGQLVWSRNLQDQIDWFSFVPVVTEKGVVITTLKGMIYILNWETGEVVNSFKAPGKGGAAISALPDGSLIIAYQTDSGIGVTVRKPDGKTAWEAETTLEVPETPRSPVIGDGAIFIPVGNAIFVFLEDGKLQGKWTFEPGAVVKGLLVLKDGAVVALKKPRSTRGAIAFVNARTWGIQAMFEGGGHFFGPPIFFNGLFIAPNEDGRIYIYR